MLLSSWLGIVLIVHCFLLFMKKASSLQFVAAEWAAKNPVD